MFSKHTQVEKLQEELTKFTQGWVSSDITDDLNTLSLKNHKRLIRSQESIKKIARQFDSPVMQSRTPLTPAQQQQESIRFMDFLVQTKLEKYETNTGVETAAKKYSDAPQTVADKSKALAQFEKEAQPHIEKEQQFNAGVNLGYATSNVCNQVASLTKNKDFGRFAQGLGAVTQAVDGINKISQASAIISQAAAANSAAQTAAATSSAVQTAATSTASGAIGTAMAGGAMMMGAIGMVIAAGSMIYSLCSEPDEEDGLGSALNMIHSTIMEMWLDMRHHFAIVFEKLDELDRKITDMERQNWKRFLASMTAIHYYGEITREQLRDLKTTSHEHLNYVHHGLESYLKTIIRADSRSVVSYIGKIGQAKTRDKLAKHSNKLEAWLTQGASIQDYSGYIPTRHNKLNITTETLITQLKNAMALEVINDGSYPLGLYASLARSIDSRILSGENLNTIVNPQDWNRVLASYIEVIQNGIPLIIKESTASERQFFIDEISNIKNVPTLVLSLLSDIRHSDTLWQKLIQDYSKAVLALQANIKQILEEKRQEFNAVYDLPPEDDILRLHESTSENITRIQGAPLPESLKIDDPIAWLQTLHATYDSQYERPQMVWGAIYDHRHAWLGGDRATGQLGSISAKQAEILFNKDKHFSKIIQDPYFLIAKKYKFVDVDLSCFHQNFQPEHPQQWDGHNTTYFTFSLRSKELKESFIQMNLYVNPSINPGGGGLHGFDRATGVNYAQWSGGGQRQMEVSQKRAISNAMKKKIQGRLEQEVLSKYRKSAAQIIATRVDFASLECASLKLFSFMKLIDPTFSIKLDSTKQSIQTLINDVATSGSIESLQKLLNTTLDVTLLSTDLKYPNPSLSSLSLSRLNSFLKKKINAKPLTEHPLWQTMAHALASLEMLEYKLTQASNSKTGLEREQIDEALSNGVLKIIEHDQAFSVGLYEMQSILTRAKLLVPIGLIKQTDLTRMTEQVTKINEQFKIRTEASIDLNDSLEDIEYTPPVDNNIPMEADHPVILSAEKKAQLAQKWIENAQSCMTFSFQETVNLLEKDFSEWIAHLLTNPNASITLLVGGTQKGKSTLANALSGATYEFTKDELGRRRVKKRNDSVIDEFTQTGTGLGSETIFPKIKLNTDGTNYLIDMPGYDDTRGEPQQISTGIAFQYLKSHCKTLKSIVMTCDENEFLSDGFVSLRTTLKNVGLMLPSWTSTSKNHVLLAITKPRGDITREGVLKLLKKLLSTEYATVTESNKLAVKKALLYLTNAPDHIVFVDVTNPASVAELDSKINALAPSKISLFNFTPSSTEMSLMKQVFQIIIDAKQELKQNIRRLGCALSMHLKNELSSICVEMPNELIENHTLIKSSLSGLDASEVDRFLDFTILVDQQKDLIKQTLVTIGTLRKLLNTNNDISFSVDDFHSIANDLIEKCAEYKANRIFFNRMIKISALFGEILPHSSLNLSSSKDKVDSKQSTDVDYGIKPKTIPITGDGNCFFRAISKALYDNEDTHEELRNLACDTVDQRRYTTLKQNNPMSYSFDIPDDMSPRRYVRSMRREGVYAEGNAIIKAMATAIKAPILIRIGASKGENKSMEHAFNPIGETANLIDSSDLENLQQVKENPLTIYLWLITLHPPHYELIPTRSRVLKSSESLDGYVTDEDLSIQLEQDTQTAILENSLLLDTERLYWKKTSVRGERILKEEDCFSMINLSEERSAFFSNMHKQSKWQDMKITDTAISIALPIGLAKK